MSEKIYNTNLPTIGGYTTRKPRCGRVTQRPWSFRLDVENELYLDSMPNKGRYVNDLIALDRRYDIMVKAKYHDLSKLDQL